MSFRFFSPSACVSAVVSEGVFATTLSVTLPISAGDASPHFTRTGGDVGFRGLVAELSQLTSPSIRVPFGSVWKSLKKYPSCHAKSQFLIHSITFCSPVGRVAVIFIDFPR